MASLTVELVNQEFSKRKMNNPRYSLRAFARDLGLHSGTLSSILHGRRKLPAYLFDDLSKKVQSLSIHRDQLKPELRRAKKESSKAFKYEKVIDERLWEEIVVEGIYFTMMSLMTCSNFKSDVSWISERLKIDPDKVKTVLEKLVKASLVKIEDGQYRLDKSTHTTRDGISSEALKRAHEEILDTSKKKLRLIDKSQRDYTSVKFAADPAKLELAKKEIRKFQNRMIKIMGASENANEVYELAMQLFPRTELLK